MQMRIGLLIEVEAQTPDEEERAEQLQRKADEIAEIFPQGDADFDDSLLADFGRALGELSMIVRRAHARTHRRRPGDE